MEEKVYIKSVKDEDGNERYSVDVLGRHEVFDTQLEAANFADAIMSINRRHKDE